MILDKISLTPALSDHILFFNSRNILKYYSQNSDQHLIFCSLENLTIGCSSLPSGYLMKDFTLTDLYIYLSFFFLERWAACLQWGSLKLFCLKSLSVWSYWFCYENWIIYCAKNGKVFKYYGNRCDMYRNVEIFLFFLAIVRRTLKLKMLSLSFVVKDYEISLKVSFFFFFLNNWKFER